MLHDVVAGGRRTLMRLSATDGSATDLLADTGLQLVSSYAWVTSADGAHVAFETKSDAGGEMTLWIAGADGSGRREVSAGRRSAGGALSALAWSPDGRHLSFVRQGATAAETQMVIVGATGEVESAVNTFMDASGVETAWSPDSGRIVLTRVGPDWRRAPFIVEVGASDGVDVSEPFAAVDATFHFQWSDAGNALAYRVKHTGEALVAPELYVASHEGQSWQGRVIPAPDGLIRMIELLAWSPDGARLLYRTGTKFDPHLLELATGTDVVLAFPSPKSATDATWSRDSQTAFVAAADAAIEDSLFSLSVTAPSPAAVPPSLEPGATVHGRSWSPDGTRLLYAASVDHSPSYALYTVRADGTGAQRISVAASEDAYRLVPTATWSPDGTAVAFLARASGVTTAWVTDLHSQTEVVAFPSFDPGTSSSVVWTSTSDHLVRLTRTTNNAVIVEVAARDGSDRRLLTPDPLTAVGRLQLTR